MDGAERERLGKAHMQVGVVLQGNNQMLLATTSITRGIPGSTNYVYTTVHPDGSFRYVEGDPATRFEGARTVQYGQFPYRDLALYWRRGLRSTAGRFSEGAMEVELHFDEGCVFKMAGVKAGESQNKTAEGGSGTSSGGSTSGGASGSGTGGTSGSASGAGNLIELRFGGVVYRTSLEKGGMFEDQPIDQYFYAIRTPSGEQVTQNGEELWGRFVRVPSADTGNRNPVWWHITWVFRNGAWVLDPAKGVQVELVGKIP